MNINGFQQKIALPGYFVLSTLIATASTRFHRDP